MALKRLSPRKLDKRQLTLEQMIEGYIEGNVSVDDLDQFDPWLWLVMMQRGHPEYETAGELWRKLGNAAVDRYGLDAPPENIRWMLQAHGHPKTGEPVRYAWKLVRTPDGKIGGICRLSEQSKQASGNIKNTAGFR